MNCKCNITKPHAYRYTHLSICTCNAYQALCCQIFIECIADRFHSLCSEWTTFYYIYEIESFTTYIVTTVWSAVAIDAAAASSSFNAIKATFAPTAPSTLLPGASTPSPSPTAQTAPTVAASASSASHSSILGSAASSSGAAPSPKIRRGETLSAICIVGAVMMIM